MVPGFFVGVLSSNILLNLKRLELQGSKLPSRLTSYLLWPKKDCHLLSFPHFSRCC